jgi:hypothetical protein
MLAVLQELARSVAQTSGERWMTGRVSAVNEDGSYQVWVAEVNLTLPRLWQAGPAVSRLLPGEPVSIRARGATWEIA